ncbi:MAG: hypothetical protein K0R14_677 [Burkholderiales bacterium]|jgi:hypothetical protein|nr:hypothetical protein [Burkholderiales bacterium]
MIICRIANFATLETTILHQVFWSHISDDSEVLIKTDQDKDSSNSPQQSATKTKE